MTKIWSPIIYEYTEIKEEIREENNSNNFTIKI